MIAYAGIVDSWRDNQSSQCSRKKRINSNDVLLFDLVLTFFSSFAPKRINREFAVSAVTSKPFLHELRVFCVFTITLFQTVRLFLDDSTTTTADDPFPERWIVTVIRECSAYSWDLLFFLVGFCLAYHVNGLIKGVETTADADNDIQLHFQEAHHIVVVFIIQFMR